MSKNSFDSFSYEFDSWSGFHHFSIFNSTPYSINFIHSETDHEIKVFRENRHLLLQLKPLESAWFKNSINITSSLPTIYKNLKSLTKQEIGKLFIHFDSTINAVKSKFAWENVCENDHFGIVYERQNGTLKDSIKSFCQEKIAILNKASETGQTIALLGRRFLAETLSHTGQNQFRDWWSKELRSREKE